MPEFYTPVHVEEAIRDIANKISKGVNVRDKKLREYQAAERDFIAAKATAYPSTTGNMKERDYQVDLATLETRERRDDAEAAWKYAEARWRALDAELRAWQSVGASVRETYRVAGRGEE